MTWFPVYMIGHHKCCPLCSVYYFKPVAHPPINFCDRWTWPGRFRRALQGGTVHHSPWHWTNRARLNPLVPDCFNVQTTFSWFDWEGLPDVLFRGAPIHWLTVGLQTIKKTLHDLASLDVPFTGGIVHHSHWPNRARLNPLVPDCFNVQTTFSMFDWEGLPDVLFRGASTD
jgi:hypothetical protein